ncbi:MAG TPA: hypothetical protein VLM17_00640 [Xanthomonadaceae bacterium]|nr:hypothetical protein [Xanthomonadaceae bacterium]
MGIPALLWWLLGGVVFPAWLLSGCADYLCHARTDIAHTSGRHESALHLLQTAEIGLPVLLFLFFEVDALVLSVLLAGVVAHTATSWADLRWATPRREITPGEQYVHSFLNVLPWIALSLVAVLHWPVVAAMFDPAVASDWGLRLRRPAFPLPLLAAVLAASLLLGVLPGLWEYARTVAAARHASSSSARSATKPR